MTDYCYFFNKLGVPVDVERVKSGTMHDKLLTEVIEILQKDWPAKMENLETKPFFIKIFDFFFCLMTYIRFRKFALNVEIEYLS